MRVWTILWILIIAVVATFAVVNWQVLTAWTVIDLIFAQVTAPLGLLMLGAMVTLGLLFLIFLVWLETKVLVDMGRASRMTSADSMQNVASRFEHMEQVVREEIARATQALNTRVDRLEQMGRIS